MSTLASALVITSMIAVAACGGGSSDVASTAPAGTTGGTTSGSTNSGRTMTATHNGVSYTPTVLTSAYINNVAQVATSDGGHSLNIVAAGITAPGTYSLALGNAKSASGQWLDDTGNYSTLTAGGSGTVTFTILQLGRVAGSFNFVAKDQAGLTTAPMTVIGTFDIKFP